MTYVAAKEMDFDLDLIIRGDGTSLWCDEASNREFHITSGRLEGVNLDEDGWVWQLELYGPKTFWECYTDKGIQREVNKKLKAIVSEKIGKEVKVIGWSEQGMQPDSGWNFDICLKEES